MKSPDECANLDDVRVGIDAIDHDIVRLLGRRLGYVLAAAQFKPSEASIAAPERVAAMLIDRRRWAAEQGLSEVFTADLFQAISNWYIATQTQHWRTVRGL